MPQKKIHNLPNTSKKDASLWPSKPSECLVVWRCAPYQRIWPKPSDATCCFNSSIKLGQPSKWPRLPRSRNFHWVKNCMSSAVSSKPPKKCKIEDFTTTQTQNANVNQLTKKTRKDKRRQPIWFFGSIIVWHHKKSCVEYEATSTKGCHYTMVYLQYSLGPNDDHLCRERFVELRAIL